MNVILFSIDSFRADKLNEKTAPNISAFANDCVVFSNAIAQGNGTLPSIPSLLTGLYPHRHGCLNENSTLGEGIPTMATLLKAKGYSTAGFVGGSYLCHEFGFDHGFNVFESEGLVKGKKHSIKKTVPQAMEFIASAEQPFFVWVHSFDLHYPFVAHRQFAERFGVKGLEVDTSKGNLQDVNEGKKEFTEAEKLEILKLYDNEVAFADFWFGRFVDFLKERGLYDNTVVVLTSDHGLEMFDHGKVGAPDENLYEEMIHMPLMIKAPTLVPQDDARLVRSIDVLPSVFDALGFPDELGVDGWSLFQHLEPDSLRAFSCIELGLKTVSMVRTERYKLVKTEFKKGKVVGKSFWKLLPRYVKKFFLLKKQGVLSFGGVEFYDLGHDRGEHNNLALTVKGKELLKELNEWRK